GAGCEGSRREADAGSGRRGLCLRNRRASYGWKARRRRAAGATRAHRGIRRRGGEKNGPSGGGAKVCAGPRLRRLRGRAAQSRLRVPVSIAAHPGLQIWFKIALGVALAVALTFLTLPVAAIFVNSSPRELASSLGDPVARDALWLSLKTTAISLALIVAIGTPAAYFLATRRFPGRAVAITLVELPLVLP